MKRLWIAVLILVVLFSATLYNTHYLNIFTSDLSRLLTRAEERAATGDWPAADKLTRQARRGWTDHTLYLHIFLRHSNTDDVDVGFREIQELIHRESACDYATANARLIARIGLLYQGEQLSLNNVL